jgi:hypothetical protein
MPSHPACTANDPLGILVYVIDCALLKSIFVLRLHVTAADINGIQFISADAAVQEFLPPGLAVEKPFPASLYEGYGEGPVLITYQ